MTPAQAIGYRHYLAPGQDFSLDDAIRNRWTVPTFCGQLFQPSDERRNNTNMPICPDCQVAQHRPTSLKPHFVYRCYDAAGLLLYVGCTSNPPARIAQHKTTSWWWPEVATTRNLVFPNRDAALARERVAIRTEMPRCNVKGRWFAGDDRSAWTAQDYLDFRYAIVQAVETTHGVYGVATRRTLAEVDTEMSERFDVSVLAKRVSS